MSFERRPHFKAGKLHRYDCGCGACRLRRRRVRAARVLDGLSDVERKAGVRMVGTTEEQRVERSGKIRERITEVIDQIMEENGWPESVRRKAEDEFATEAVRAVGRRQQDLPKIWAGKTFSERRAGAISSLQVLLGHHAPFRTQKGRLQEAKGNADWVLDCWDVALEEWEGQRQLRLV
jgi:hypothetical protein